MLKCPDHNEVYYTLHSIQLIDSTTGWAVGNNGLIVKCTVGSPWQTMTKITDLPLNKVCFADEKNGFIAGGYLNWDGDFQAVLFKTTNGGESWEKIPDLHYLINDMYFHDTQHGWAIGVDKSGKSLIVSTNDGGEHWTAQVDSLIGPLHALSYRDGYLWAVGDYGLVLRTDLTTPVHDYQNQHLPFEFELFQNYPNPFNAITKIRFTLPEETRVTLVVYDLLGREVATLMNMSKKPGSYEVEFNAANLASGLYFCKIETAKFREIKKMVLIR